jgi:hypothetical protein
MKDLRRLHDPRCIGTLILLAAVTVLAGCAGASITPGSGSPQVSSVPVTQAARPAEIVVSDFTFAPSAVHEGTAPLQRLSRAFSSQSQNQDKSEIGSETAKAISEELTKKLQALGFTVVRQPAGTPIADNALVIDGQFTSIDEGNRLRRLVIGFGAGASKLDTDVQVARVSSGERQQVLNFKTEANSGRMPGAAVTMGAGAAAQGGATVAMGAANAGIAGVKGYRGMVSRLAEQTADQISGYLAQYFEQQGWITAAQAKEATRVKLSTAAPR